MRRPKLKRHCIQNGHVVLPSEVILKGTVVLAGRKIEYAGPARATPAGAEAIDARGGYVCPGLIDCHIHGAGPNSFDPPEARSFQAIADCLLSRGIVQHVPAMMASEEMIGGIAALIEDTGLRRRVPGLYVEGPFVNPAKRGGIQPAFVLPPDPQRIARLQRLARGRILLMVFAPELEGAEALPRAMRAHGILPCVGHTLATCQRAAEVVGRFKVNVTHLFNAMSGVHHNEPGAAVFGLIHDNAYVELNPDGAHVCPQVLKLVYRAKPVSRIVLISDAVVSAGGPPGECRYMGKAVVATENGVYYKEEGTLVGSRLLLNQGVARFMKLAGAPVEDAVRMASLNPAALLGLSRRKGSLEAGKDADVAVFPRSFAKARVVFFEGRRLIG